MSHDLPPAGWYPNPDGTGGLRWWSGVGWTEYTRSGPPAAEPDATPAEPSTPDSWQTQQLDQAAATTEPATEDSWQTPQLDQPPAPTQTASPESQQTQQLGQAQAPAPADPWQTQQLDQAAPTTWGQPAAPGPQYGGYAPYQPPAKAPLTPSGMRPLSGMFGDIGRITRRAWLPILGISLALWAVVSVIYAAVLLGAVDLTALQRGFDLIGSQTSPETGVDVNDAEISAAFRDAFSALSPAAWAGVAAALTLLLLVVSALQTAAVTRLAMDAAAGQPVSWAAGWKSGFTAGFRLFGYYLLLGILAGFAWLIYGVVTVGLWALNPALGVIAGILGFLALMVLTLWISGRLIPVIVQVVRGRRAISWSWQHTKGKFWAVLGRYLLWSLAASVIVNIVVSVFSIPVSLIFLDTASTASSTAQLGTSLVLTLITLPFSLALSAITFIGVVPIWRDLTDEPAYRAIDEQGIPVQVTSPAPAPDSA